MTPARRDVCVCGPEIFSKGEYSNQLVAENRIGVSSQSLAVIIIFEISVLSFILLNFSAPTPTANTGT